MQTLSVIKDVVTIFATFVGGWIAYQGLSTWHRQLKGNSEHELAKRLRLSAGRFKDTLIVLRAAGSTSWEASHAMKELGWTIDETNKDQALKIEKLAVRNVRWAPMQERKQDLRINCLEAEILWGKEIADAYREVDDAIHKLWVAYITEDMPLSGNTEADHKRMIEQMKIMFPTGETPEDDEFMVTIDKAISRLDGVARKHLVGT